jgi:hypothetical protein
MDLPFAIKGAVQFTGHDPVPDADVVICSNLYRSAVQQFGGDTSNLATVDGAVFDGDSPRPVGITSLAIG